MRERIVGGVLPRLTETLSLFLTTRFMQFCAVGASGVLVNLGLLTTLNALGVVSSLASAAAIQLSIVSNFIFNDRWTFRHARGVDSLIARSVRFQFVSLIGATIQWCVFIASNVVVLGLVQGDLGMEAYLSNADSVWSLITLAVREPPEIGYWIVSSQLVGIGVATAWNFLANFYWTWAQSSGASSDMDQ